MIRKIIGFVIFLVPGAVILLFGFTDGYYGGVLVGILLILPGLFLVMKKPKTQEEKEETRRIKAEWKKRIDHEKTIVYCKHQIGLPLAEGANCEVWHDEDEDKVVIASSGNAFNLAFSKVTDITIKTDEEIQKAYVSSIGGAVGGAVLFGTLGAMVGGRAKEKESKTRDTRYPGTQGFQ